MHRHPLAVITSRSLIVAALAAATLAIPGYASARPAPLDPHGSIPVSVHIPPPAAAPTNSSGAKLLWLNPLSGLNLDRSSVAG